MQDVLGTGSLFGDGDGCGATRINKDRAATAYGLAGEPLLLLADRAALQIRNPVHEKIIGLGLVGVVADGPEHVSHFRIFVAVVQLVDAHVAGGVTLGVVGRTIMNAHLLRLQTGEDQLAAAPGIFITTAGAAVVEEVEINFIRTVFIENLLGEPGVECQCVLPRALAPVGAAIQQRLRQAAGRGAFAVVHEVPEHAAARGGLALIHHTILVRNDHDVVTAAVVVLNGVDHTGRQAGLQRRELAGEIQTQRVVLRRTAAFLMFRPFVDFVATADDAEVAGQVGGLRAGRRQGDAIIEMGHAGDSCEFC